ncbi:protein cornichon homolog 4 isoform X4 [Ursus maritimus]|uniref:Protein cornichon homolog 4 isoform X4 n=1 Tax=Ursus maritimus TaxID=29073 RepID=A0A8M1G8V4_URSMA|nr:protein cornichon homolog 4 isoform X4 [Ursus maritimus]
MRQNYGGRVGQGRTTTPGRPRRGALTTRPTSPGEGLSGAGGRAGRRSRFDGRRGGGGGGGWRRWCSSSLSSTVARSSSSRCTSFIMVPSGNMGVFDPTEIHNRGQLKSHMKEAMIKLGFHLLCFFMYLYSMILALIND